MASEAKVVPAMHVHVELFGCELTAADDAEAVLGGWSSARPAFRQRVDESAEAWAVVLNGRVGCLLGVRPRKDGDGGQLWFHSVAYFAEHGRAFLRRARSLIAEMLERWGVLHGLIDPLKPAMVRLSAWLGFELGPVEPYGPLAYPFHCAVLRRH